MRRMYRNYTFSRSKKLCRRIGLPLTVFVMAASLISNVGNWLNVQLHKSETQAASGISKKFYQAPSFHVFEGLFITDAMAGPMPPAPSEGDDG